MITNEELRISNKSYIDKDFAVIYPELVREIQNLTNRWDPETSNESDPGVVLTKIVAFIGDKLNYNIDKNILEDFITSCTQDSSMRKLCDMLGYSMKYFVAATTNLTLTYVGELSDPITFPALETVFTSKDEDTAISFIATRNCTLSKQNDVQTCPVMQGYLRELQVNTSGDVTTNENKPLIQLSNLDDNNRIYFPETNVAQNGVFILEYPYTGEFWEVKKTLNDVEPMTRCFKFGYDSNRELPYIEFPKDIASLIGNGLYVRYILTDGYNGNVSANTINALDSTTSDSWNSLKGAEEDAEDNLYVRNYSATINGASPESINEAYNNFKKTIGTFNTLTTCRDYSNAIYNAYDSDGVFPLVSNVQVSDRRNDINYTKRVVSYDELGETTINVTDADELNAYQLCCYPLAPIFSYSDVEVYDNSFLPLTSAGKTVTSEIERAIEENKTISHDYKTLEANDIYAIKNKLTLDGRLTTNYKVNAYEVVEIDTNVIHQLIEDFNARRVDYGYEIPYDSLVESIQKADKRINYVSLMEPELTTYILKRNGLEVPLVSVDGSDFYVDILAKNILNGNVSLFDYDDRFEFELGQKEISGKNMINEHVKSIKTDLNLTLTPNVNTKLYKNEAVQFIAPNVITELTYPAYCYFRFVSATHDVSNPVTANTIYQLQAGEILYMGFTENDTWKCEMYVAGQIIKPVGFDLFATPNTWSTSDYSIYNRSAYTKVNTKDNNQTEYFWSLTAQESIEISKVNKVILNKKTKCYWLRNNSTNRLFTSDEWSSTTGGEAILKEGEYFFYTDAAETQLVTLGSGTKISSELSNLETITADVVDLSDVLEMGMLALKDKWKTLSFSSTTPFTIVENNILTLTEGDTLSITIKDGGSTSSFVIDSDDLSSVPDDVIIHYGFDGDPSETLDNLSITEGGWKARTRLHVNVSRNESQIIDEEVEGTTTGRQSVTFTLENNSTVVLDTQGQNFNLNTEMHNEGGLIDTSITVKTDSGNTVTYPVTMYCYEVALDDDNEPQTPLRNLEGYATYKLDSQDVSGTTYTFDLPLISRDGNDEFGLIMVYLFKTGGSTAQVKFATGPYNGKHYNTSESYGSPVALNEGINIIELHRTGTSGTARMTIENNGVEGTVTIGTLDFISGLNKELALKEFADAVNNSSVTEQSLTEDLMEALENDKFYYNCKIDNAKAIESENLMSPYAFYDANNIANRFTISQIDFKTSNVDVLKSSRQ